LINYDVTIRALDTLAEIVEDMAVLHAATV
jgi:hypothetical protein